MASTAPGSDAPRRNHRVTYAVLATGVMAFAVLQSLVTPILPTIQRELHTSQSTVTWVLTVYLLSASIFTPILGRIGDRVGKKKMFLVGMAALAAGSLLAAVTDSIGLLIVARAIQGVGGGVLPLVFGIIRDEFPPEKVSGAVGSVAALTAAGSGLGIVLAGPIIQVLSYHWLFWIPLIVVSGAALAAYFVVPESRNRAEGRISILGGVLLSTWLVAFLVAISQGSKWGWTSGRTIGLFVVALALAIAWYVSENRSSAPLIDMKMMRRPAVWTTNLVALLFGAGMYAAFAFLPSFVQAPRHLNGYGFDASITMSGFFLLPLTMFMFLFGTFSGRIAERIGSKLVLAAGSAISVVGYGIIAFAHDYEWEVFIASGVIGAALGFGFSAMSSLIVVAVPPDQTGVATGMNANIRTIGGSIGSAVTASVVTAAVGGGGLPKESGYTNGYAILTGMSVLATLAVFLIPVSRRASHEHVEMPHAELALVAGGTLLGDEPE